MENVEQIKEAKAPKVGSMKGTKAKELDQRISLIEEFLKTVDARAQQQHQLLQSILVLMKNYDARLMTLQKISFQHELSNEEDFSDRVDNLLGLRRKGPEEKIEAGDVVWVKYEALIGDKKEVEQSLPIRIGSGSVVFENALIGKGTEEKGVEFVATLKDGKGDVKFLIDVLKVKVKMPENTGEVKNEPTGDNGSGNRAEVDAGPAELST